MATVLHPLPGIAFDAQVPPADDVLPRMDVAGFVGFATTGPVDLPVAVQDMAQFADVFGEPVALFWDAAAGQQTGGHLAGAVDAFFRNGGTRCWVVRVTGRRRADRRAAGDPLWISAAARAVIPVAGLAWVGADGVPEQADIPVRTAGGWADELAVSAGLLQRSVVLDDLAYDASGAPPVRARARVGSRIQPGDLVRAVYDTAQLLFAVGAVAPGPSGLAVSGTDALWLSTASLGGPVTGRALGSGGPIPVAVEDAPGGVRLRLAAPIARAPAPGTLLRLELDGHGTALVFAADSRAESAAGGSVVSGPLFRPLATPPPARPSAAQVLTFELRARIGPDRLTVLDELGFAPGHPRHAGALPTDEQLYGRLPTADDPRPPALPDLWVEALRPRFPLAGTAGRPLYPLGMDALAEPLWVSARPDPRPRLVRDGLGGFNAGLFLDPALAGSSPESLLSTAEFLRDQSADPRPLVGVHALFGIDEITLVAAPDSVHGPWRQAAAPPLPAPPPEPYARPPAGCRHASGQALEDCSIRMLAAPLLDPAAADPLGDLHLSWQAVAGPDPVYVLEESVQAWTWSAAREVHRGPETSADLYGRGPGAYFYRVRAETADAASDWSAGRAVVVPAGDPWIGADADGSELVAIQRALLNLCAARGDLLAVLALPRQFDADAAAGHAALLRIGTDDRTSSFGVLYHPWLVPTAADPVPPDGAATGVLARIARLRGCWAAPANQPLADVVALRPVIGPASYPGLQAANVDILRQEPRGFVCLDDATLSVDPDLRQVTVRRLLSLLRRTAGRYGPDFVFEPDGGVLRRHVRRKSEALLGFLFARGALAGDTPDESFRVAVASRPESGQLVVELRVAPSLPLRFLTVRMIHAADRSVVVEGV